MIPFQALLAACESVYDSPSIVAGPDGRDAASYDPASGTLAIRGTLTDGAAAKADWENDFDAVLVSDSRFPGRIHKGFLSSASNLWPFVKDFKPQYITGHSKGGSVAILLGWLFRDCKPTVVTFAAAKVGNETFAKAYDLLCLNFINPEDIVPRVPLFYSNPGIRVLAPASFTPPHGVAANHHLETGYKPWVPK